MYNRWKTVGTIGRSIAGEKIVKEQFQEVVNKRIDLLLAVYQQSRNEGLQIAHSIFRDLSVILLVVVTIIGGQMVTDRPELLTIMPAFLGIWSICDWKVSCK